MKPAIVSEGLHNFSMEQTIERLEKSKTYRDLSTIILCPTRGLIADRVVQNWMSLMRPMNQKVAGPLFIRGMEVGEAYNTGIQLILDNPEMSKWQYVLTLEEDNMPPPDGLLKLYENIDDWDVLGGLYFTKGEGGQPMLYGDPAVMPRNYIPQIPKVDAIQPCNGLGMGFNLFKLELFRSGRVPKPWFKTKQERGPGGIVAYTQDLYFYEQAAMRGCRFASDNRVRVGHYDVTDDRVW